MKVKKLSVGKIKKALDAGAEYNIKTEIGLKTQIVLLKELLLKEKFITKQQKYPCKTCTYIGNTKKLLKRSQVCFYPY